MSAYAQAITLLVKTLGYDEHHRTENLDQNKYIAAMLLGYGASLLKTCGVPLSEVKQRLEEAWLGMQGG